MTHASPMSSTTGSTAPSAEPVRRAAVITHGRPEAIGPALARVESVAREAGVELLFPDEEVAKHGVPPCEADVMEADIAIVLGHLRAALARDRPHTLDGFVEAVALAEQDPDSLDGFTRRLRR